MTGVVVKALLRDASVTLVVFLQFHGTVADTCRPWTCLQGGGIMPTGELRMPFNLSKLSRLGSPLNPILTARPRGLAGVYHLFD